MGKNIYEGMGFVEVVNALHELDQHRTGEGLNTHYDLTKVGATALEVMRRLAGSVGEKGLIKQVREESKRRRL